LEVAATARDQSAVNEFIQEQTRQVLVRYGRMKASAAELINIKYQVSYLSTYYLLCYSGREYIGGVVLYIL